MDFRLITRRTGGPEVIEREPVDAATLERFLTLLSRWRFPQT